MPPNLFLLFARLEPTPERIQKFANRFGWLSLQYSRGYPRSFVSPSERIELLSEWRREIETMARAAQVWWLLQQRDEAKLRKVIQWHISKRETRVVYTQHKDLAFAEGWIAHKALIASSRHNSEWLSRFADGDVVTPARLYLQELINERIGDLVRARMLWDEKHTRLSVHLVASHAHRRACYTALSTARQSRRPPWA